MLSLVVSPDSVPLSTVNAPRPKPVTASENVKVTSLDCPIPKAGSARLIETVGARVSNETGPLEAPPPRFPKLSV